MSSNKKKRSTETGRHPVGRHPAKKDLVLEKKGFNPVYLAPVAVLAIVVPVIIIAVNGGRTAPREQRSFSSQLVSAEPSASRQTAERVVHTPISSSDGVVRVDTSGFEDGKARYFEFREGGSAVRFFVLQSSDGVMRAAFDACDVCYASRRGYRQLGDIMICNNCGQSFPSELINVQQGGCNPAPLDRTAVEGSIAIQVADITAGARFF